MTKVVKVLFWSFACGSCLMLMLSVIHTGNLLGLLLVIPAGFASVRIERAINDDPYA